MKTIGKLWGNEGIHAGAVVVLSGVLVLLMTKGDGVAGVVGAAREVRPPQRRATDEGDQEGCHGGGRGLYLAEGRPGHQDGLSQGYNDDELAPLCEVRALYRPLLGTRTTKPRGLCQL